MNKSTEYDAIIIGGGFYGCEIALHLKKHLKNVLIIEKEHDLMTRASAINQARVHNGYHYPRSFITALRSHHNFERFTTQYKKAIDKSFTKLYAIASQNSKVTAHQFETFCARIGLKIKTPTPNHTALFSPQYIETVFEVEEIAFNIDILRSIIKKRLEKEGIEVKYDTAVQKISSHKKGLSVVLADGTKLSTTYCFNCTYAFINEFLQNSGLPTLPFKYELTEMALIDVPSSLRDTGITIMDGPFFSCMPYPSQKLHSLSHVRYTPHTANERWELIEKLETYQKSNYSFMIKDAVRYVPLLQHATFKKSLFEIKTLLQGNEIDDGRPILLRKDYAGIKNLFIVMGGKIDNIYDILQMLNLNEDDTSQKPYERE